MPKPLNSRQIASGDEIPHLVKHPTQVALFRYSAVTWNGHRIHYDRDYAATEGYPNVLVQGHLHGAYLTQMLLDWIGPDGRLERLQWSNRRPAFPGDTLTCRGHVTRVYEENEQQMVDCEISDENQSGEVCANGTAIVSLGASGTLSG